MSDEPPLDPGEESTSAPAGEESPATSTGPRPRRSQTGRRARRRARKAARSKLRRRLTRAGIGVVLLIVLVLGGAGGFVYFKLHEIGHITVRGLSATTRTGKNAGADDILLVGSTDRCAVSPQNHFQNFVNQCLSGVNGINSDVVMILRLVPNKPPTLLSIPRDTFVPNARSGGLYNRIDAALADGPGQLVTAIQQDFGIPINHFVVLNFETFSNIVTALGGITMYFPTSLYDSYSGLDITHRGCLHISGLEALALVRARHLQYDYDKATGQWLGYDPSGDIGRIERVHIFLNVLAAQVAKQGLSNPLTDSRLLSALAPDLTVDSTFSTNDMISLVRSFHGSIGDAVELTLPIVEDTVTYTYKGYDYGLVSFPTQPQDDRAVARFLGSAPSAAVPKKDSFTISVVDGNDSPTTAAAAASSLKSLGYDVVADTASQPSVGPIAETTVAYTAGHLQDAQEVLRSISGVAVLGEVPTSNGADVSVITGSDFQVASPSHATATATSSLTSAAMSGIPALLTADSTGPLSSPTTATSAIPSYDPRACPAKH